MGLLKTAARATVASSVHGRVQRRQQQKWAAQDTASLAQQPVQVHHVVQAPPAPPAPPAPAAGDEMQQKIELLRQLGELRDSGIIDEAEFAVKKAQILS
ncbi:MAG: SHOCT domain-containing protein [Microthrixaceae bacterium]